MANEKKTNRLPGFYIAVCCCVLIIGVAGYFTERKEKNEIKYETKTASNIEASDSTPKPAKDYPDGKVISVSEIKPVEEAPTQAQSEQKDVADASNNTLTEDYTANNPDVAQTVTLVQAEEMSFVMPASGDILADYCDKPQYNDALCDYRAHNGIDIACDEGCSISAAADGVIEDISSNAFGECITISHKDGYMTKYECLGSVEKLNKGDSVKAGDVIGTVGQSKGENVKESHLHFELYKDNTVLNPSDYLM